MEGVKKRVRSETFADHYSQARQFYISQTEIEKRHIKNAYVFELSKCERLDIRERMVSHLLNVDMGLAQEVAEGLGLKEMPEAAEAAMPTRTDLPESPALSIVLNGPKTFKGRKIGVLVSEGVDAGLFRKVQETVEAEGAKVAVVAPTIGGVMDSDGNHLPAVEKVDGGPSVLFDAVVLLPSAEGVVELAKDATAGDFVDDAFAHCKFIGYTPAARKLFDSVGLTAMLDDGCVPFNGPDDADRFVQACRQVRFWPREEKVDRF